MVEPGELFFTDAFQYEFSKDEYLCFEITFSGCRIPYHEESLLPAYILTDCGWQYSKKLPFPAMIGCDRKVTEKICYLGDSITQGIGAVPNSYKHWTALLSEMIGYSDCSFWNLGIGYARADDAATNGAWLYKVKQNDIIFICLGVNDMFRFSEAQIIHSLNTIVDILHKENKKIILQTVPSFDYDKENTEKWKAVNSYILNTLSLKVDFVFNNVPYLCESIENSNVAKYGGHPNNSGCEVWG